MPVPKIPYFVPFTYQKCAKKFVIFLLWTSKITKQHQWLLINWYISFFPGYLCNFVRGDGVGGTEQNIGSKPTPQACIDACVYKKKTDPQINGVTITPSGKGSCYCERKMVKSNNSPSWKTCQLQSKDNHKCKFSGPFSQTSCIHLKP